MKASARRTGGSASKNSKNNRHRRCPRTEKESYLQELESRLLLTALDVTTVVWNNVSQSVVRNEYIFQSGMRVSNFNTFLNQQGLHTAGVRSLGGDFYLAVDSIDSVSAVGVWAGTHRGIVTSFGPNHPVYARTTPNESTLATWAAQWHYQNNGQTINNIVGVPGADIDAVRAWDIATGNRTNVAAVIDTGVNYNSPDLAANMWTNPGEIAGDGIDNDGDGIIDDVHGADFTGAAPTGDPLDQNGHGTEVAGLIGAVGNNSAAGPFVGVNWTTQIMAVRVLDASGVGTDASILAGINYVTFMKSLRSVNVVVQNMSLGRLFAGPTSGVADPGIAQLFNAIDRAGQVGIITVGATDEQGLDLDQLIGTSNDFPTASTNAFLLSVTASDNRDQLASFADQGGHVIDLAAPGDTIAGVGLTASGTSFASPLVAGAVALLKSLVPNATPAQLVDAIRRGVDVVPGLVGKVRTNGRLNVFHSLELLLGNKAPVARIETVTTQRITGWMFDPNAGAAPIYGALFIDGQFVSTFLASQNRPDLAAVAGSPQHGFSVSVPGLTAGNHKIQVYALDVVPNATTGEIRHPITTLTNLHDLNNTNSAFNMVPVLVTNFGPGVNSSGGSAGGGGVINVNGNVPPIGFLDFADPTHIVGWAFDAQAGPLPVDVDVYIDGQLVASGRADKNRPDLTVLNLGSINHGFDILTPTNLSVGPHRVTAYAKDTTTNQPVFIGSRTLLENSPLNYFVDNTPGSSNLAGYVYNPDTPDTTVPLEIDVDGQMVGFYPTQGNLNRLDVPITNQNHGFNLTLPPLEPGAHFVQLIAYHPGTGVKTVLAARNLVGNRLPVGSFAVNNSNLTGFVFDQDPPIQTLNYRVEIDGKPGTAATGTLGNAGLNGPIVNTPVTPTQQHTVGTNVLDITQFGADGSIVHDTFAIQTAINNASALAGGGTVLIGAGTWQTNPITLRSNVTLDIEGVLQLPAPANYNGNANTPLLRGTNIVNFALIGGGEIDGFTQRWGNTGGPQLLRIDGSDRILIQGTSAVTPFTFFRAPSDAIAFGTAVVNNALTGTNNVTINQVAINYTGTVPAASTGIIVVGHNYLIENVVIGVASDAIRILPQEVSAHDIEITQGTFTIGTGVLIGPNTLKGADTIVVEDCSFANMSYGLRIDSRRGQGGVVQNIAFRNITESSVAHPLIISEVSVGGAVDAALTLPANTQNGPVTEDTPFYQNILVDTLTAGGSSEAGIIFGLTNSRIAGVTLRNYTAAGTMKQFNVIGLAELAVAVNIIQISNIIEMPSDAFYYNLVTPLLSAGTHTFNLFAVDPINGDNVLVRTFTLVVPSLSKTNSQPIGVITATTTSAIAGYVIDPNSAATETVEIEVDGVLQTTVAANKFQPNLPIQFGPNHGYVAPLNLTVGRHVVAVYSRDLADPTKRVFIGSTVITQGPAPSGTINLARGDFLVATAKGFSTQPPTDWVFRFTIDGHTGNLLTAATSGTVINGSVQLTLKTPPIDPNKSHVVTLDYIDPLTLIPTTVATSVIPAVPAVIGGITSSSNSFLAGYVISRTLPTKSLTLYLTSDNLPIQNYQANINLANIGPHGFFISTLGTPAGTHVLRLYAVDPTVGVLELVGTKTVTIPQP